MKKSEILNEIGFDELIGSPFEDLMEVCTIEKGTSRYYPLDEPLPAFYLLEGRIQFTLFSPEGKEFYLELSPGDMAGLNMNLSLALHSKYGRRLEGEMSVKDDSVVVELPMDKLLSLQLENREIILEKLLTLSVNEALERTHSFFSKTLYSDEELLLKTIEKYKILNYSTRELSEVLNINIRTLQRKLLNLSNSGIIKKTNSSIQLINQEKLDIYKSRFKG